MGFFHVKKEKDQNRRKIRIRINKNYQNVNGEELIASPKTPKSNRVVTIPVLLVNCLREYMEKWYGLEQDDRIFPLYKEHRKSCHGKSL